ncbi:MAG: hypothetical protein WBX25_24105 [Rhodomicrobium sp.]
MAKSAQQGDDSGDTISAQKETYEPSTEGDPSTKWLSEIKVAKMREEKWRKKALDILARYRQERALEIHSNKPTDKKFNILWSNTEVLMAHLTGDLGMPDVRRQFPFPGQKTRIARTAAEILEKVLIVENHAFDVAEEFEACVEDSLLPGRGQVWIDLDEIPDDESNDNKDWLEARICHVDWEMYLEGPSRRWDQVPWVGRMHLFDKDDLRDNFSNYADQIPLNYELDNTNEQTKESLVASGRETVSRAPIWEVWVKNTKERLYVAEDFPKILRVDVDPYRLKDFFPCPKPLYAVKTTNTRIPIPLFAQYQDQADELDRLTTRGYRLVETLKYCGIYGNLGEGDDTLQDLSRLEDGEFMPYKGFAALLQSGGLEKAFMVRELQPIMAAIQGVGEKHDWTVQKIWEITGIADIMRGISDPNETLGAQELKARYGSNRAQRRQKLVQRFVRDAYRLKAEVISEHYKREQLQEMTGISLPTKDEQAQAKKAMQEMQLMAQQGQQQGLPPPQVTPESGERVQAIIQAVAWDDVSKILRTNTRRLFMVDIETDDTAFQDEEDQKSSAIEFLKAFFETMQGIVPAVQQYPALLPLAKELVLFSVDAFKVGQAFEDAINDAFDKIAQMPPAPPGGNDPKAKLAAQQGQLLQMKTQNEAMKLQNSKSQQQQDAQDRQADMQARAQNIQQDQQAHNQSMQEKAVDMQNDQERMQFERQKMQMELQEMVERIMMERERHQTGLVHEQQTHQQGLIQGQQTHQVGLIGEQQSLQQGAEAHQAKQKAFDIKQQQVKPRVQ